MKLKLLLLVFLLNFLGITAQDYVVESVGFNPPHSYIQMNANTNLDDYYSEVIPLGFDFDFYGNSFNEVIIGGNGIINFNTFGAGNNCPWAFEEDIPSEAMEIKNSIFGVYHDMDPTVSQEDEINYAQYGTAPNRRFVVNFYQVPHFSCNELISTIQVVLYETTNTIEIFVKDKPSCQGWNNGNAVLGIQNDDGTEGVAAPNRNTSDSPWEAYNEAWRFSYYDGDTVEAYPFAFSVCDQGNGGFELFDFSLIEGDVIGNQGDVTVTYHETFLDANANINPLISPYLNTTNPQEVYARVENNEGLYATSNIILEVIPCIDNDNDGVSTMNEDLNGDGYPGNDDTDNDGIPNYLDPDDDNDYVNTQTETIGIGAGFGQQYIFIDSDEDGIENYLDNDDDGDGALTVYEDYNNNGTPLDDDINSNNIPDFLDPDVTITGGVIAYQPEDLTQCDDNNDGFSIFNLTNTEAEIIGGQDPSELVISFYLSQAEAGDDIDAITDPTAFENISNPQTIFARVESIANGEYEITNFDLLVYNAPEPVEPTPLIICDENNNDGFAEFNLHDKDSEIAAENSNVSVTYHVTFLDAEVNMNPIPSPYVNEVPFYQIVFARVEDETTGCFEIVELELIINLGPEVVEVTELLGFDENNDGFGIFDLTSKIPEILNGQTNVEVTFFETPQDAYENIEVIENPSAYTNISNPQTIYARMDGENSCFSIANFVLIPDPNLGLGEDFYAHLKLFPNPTSGILNIQSNQLSETVSIRLYSLHGQILLEENKAPSNEAISLDFSSLNTGVYFVKISSEEGTVVKKIVKE